MTEPMSRAIRPNRLPSVVAAIALLVLLVDQGTKLVAVDKLTNRGRVDLVGDLFGLRLIRNSGAAFSMATGATWVLTVVALVVVVVIVRVSRRLGSRGWALAFGLLLGGAFGNLADRLFREPGFFRGHVVDFLELPHWPIFNVADSCIVTAACLIALLSVRGVGLDGQRSLDAPAVPEARPADDEGDKNSMVDDDSGFFAGESRLLGPSEPPPPATRAEARRRASGR